jgi:hypothetical protein
MLARESQSASPGWALAVGIEPVVRRKTTTVPAPPAETFHDHGRVVAPQRLTSTAGAPDRSGAPTVLGVGRSPRKRRRWNLELLPGQVDMPDFPISRVVGRLFAIVQDRPGESVALFIAAT